MGYDASLESGRIILRFVGALYRAPSASFLEKSTRPYSKAFESLRGVITLRSDEIWPTEQQRERVCVCVYVSLSLFVRQNVKKKMY